MKAKILLVATEDGVEIVGEEAKITTAMADLKHKAPNTSTLKKTNGIILAKKFEKWGKSPSNKEDFITTWEAARASISTMIVIR